MPGVSCCGVMNDIEERWRGILKRRPFPRVYAGVEVEGIELVSLDTFALRSSRWPVMTSGQIGEALQREVFSSIAAIAEQQLQFIETFTQSAPPNGMSNRQFPRQLFGGARSSFLWLSVAPPTRSYGT
jgi:hypothetical protein